LIMWNRLVKTLKTDMAAPINAEADDGIDDAANQESLGAIPDEALGPVFFKIWAKALDQMKICMRVMYDRNMWQCPLYGMIAVGTKVRFHMWTPTIRKMDYWNGETTWDIKGTHKIASIPPVPWLP
jgi:hypothetical protein